MSSPGQPDPAHDEQPSPSLHPSRRWAHRIRWTRWLIAAAVPAAFVVVPPLSDLRARLIAGCAAWVGIATLLELGSVLGFVVAFALVFGRGLTARESLVAGLRALGASTILPGGSLVGPALGARSLGTGGGSLRRLAAPSIAFVVLTTAPGVLALALAGISLWLGWPPGPHGALATLPAAAAALAVLTVTWLLARSPDAAPGSGHPRTHRLRWLTGAVVPIRAGAADARRLVMTRDWKLLGAVAYYVFDNAVLWAAFRAYGSEPPVGVLLMGYLVGSLGSALPIPAGLGTVEGGLIGALVLYGAPLAPAAAAVLLYRGISLGLAVALGGCGWAWRPRSRRARAADPGNSRTTSSPSIILPRSSLAPRRRPSPAAAHSSE